MMREKILVVDDDADIVESLVLILEYYGFITQTLLSGDQVAETIEVFRPDLILMDVMLSGSDGREICKSLKQHPATRAIPVILISASHDLYQCMQQEGAPNDFIKKPFDIDNLLTKVRQRLVAKPNIN